MSQFALDRVLTVAGTYAATNSKKGITAGDVAFLCDQVTDPSLSFTSETEDIVDARNNVVMTLQGARGATFGASNAFFNAGILAAQTGGKLASEEVTFTKYDILTLDADKKAAITADPSVTTPAVTDFKVYQLASDNSLTTAAALTPTTDYTFTTGEISVVKTGAAAGDRILVVYSAKESGEHIVAKADADNELLNVTAEVLLRELCNEELYYAFIIIKGKLSGESEWSMTRDGKHAFEIKAAPAYCDADKKLVEVVIVKGENM